MRASLAAGTVFAEDYRILRPLSSGGMGAVYVALQLSTERERALKVMLPELVGDGDLRRRFAQEAKIGARIASEHVVEVVGAGIDVASGAPWLAMELLEGEDLGSHLEAAGPLSLAEVQEILEQLAHALGAAHAEHVVHRDLKPENIFLAETRRARSRFVVKVLDFGIAKLVNQARTSATAAIGTPLWMAPEQTQANAPVTPAADVWAMGLLAFRMLVGKHYWRSAAASETSAMMLLREMMMDPLVPASERAAELGGVAPPEGFDGWFARCVAREPGERFPEARSLYEAFRADVGAPADERENTESRKPTRKQTKKTRRAERTVAARTIEAGPLGDLAGLTAKPAEAPRIPAPPRRERSSNTGLWVLVALVVFGGGVTALVLLLGTQRGKCGDGQIYVQGGSPFGAQIVEAFEPGPVAAFCVDRAEVTVERAKATTPALERTALAGAACADRPLQPCNCVTAEAAEAWCRAQGGRLPTRAEWSRARVAPRMAEASLAQPATPNATPRASTCSAGSMPCESGSTDVAPSGVVDLDGGVSEWAKDTDGSFHVMGADWRTTSNGKGGRPGKGASDATGLRCVHAPNP